MTTQIPFCPPTHMLGCPPTSTCPPTHMLGCPPTSTCPPTHMYGCPPTHTCPPQTITTTLQPTFACHIPTMACQPQTMTATVQAPPMAMAAAPHMVGQTGVYGCTQSPAQCGNTAWQGCLIGPTGWLGCTQPPAQAANVVGTAATICTQYGCQTHVCQTHVQATNCPPATVCPSPTTLCAPEQNAATIGQTGVYGCTQSPAQCGHTAWHGCPPVVGPTGWLGCTQPPAQATNVGTAATVCTQIGCPPGPTAWLGCTCLPMTVGPVMTVAGTC